MNNRDNQPHPIVKRTVYASQPHEENVFTKACVDKFNQLQAEISQLLVEGGADIGRGIATIDEIQKAKYIALEALKIGRGDAAAKNKTN